MRLVPAEFFSGWGKQSIDVGQLLHTVHNARFFLCIQINIIVCVLHSFAISEWIVWVFPWLHIRTKPKNPEISGQVTNIHIISLLNGKNVRCAVQLYFTKTILNDFILLQGYATTVTCCIVMLRCISSAGKISSAEITKDFETPHSLCKSILLKLMAVYLDQINFETFCGFHAKRPLL